MPLGDSITESATGHASYRYWLWGEMRSNGYRVDFVGTQQGVYGGAPQPADFDLDHEGHWGSTARNIADRIGQWARATRPDIVLCHVGTADLLSGQSVSTTLSEVARIVAALRAVNPEVKIFLAQLIPAKQGANSIIAFNQALPAFAARLHSSTSPLLVVDQWSDFQVEQDTFDGFHPNESGERKMAERWYQALQTVTLSPEL